MGSSWGAARLVLLLPIDAGEDREAAIAPAAVMEKALG